LTIRLNIMKSPSPLINSRIDEIQNLDLLTNSLSPPQGCQNWDST